MARFRSIPREQITSRRAESNACLHYGLYHSATLTACSGIELLLEFLVTKLHEDLAQSRRRRANALLTQLQQEERANNATTTYWGLRSWADFFRKRGVFDSLNKQFGFKFDLLNDYTLSQANESWNRCKHDPHVASREEAQACVRYLNAYLEETEFQYTARNMQHVSVGDMSSNWLAEWEATLQAFIAGQPDSAASEVLLCLPPLLDLTIRLIDDTRVQFDYKTALMVAANYVFSSVDLVPGGQPRERALGAGGRCGGNRPDALLAAE